MRRTDSAKLVAVYDSGALTPVDHCEVSACVDIVGLALGAAAVAGAAIAILGS